MELADLAQTIAERGPAAFLVTVRETRPHIVSVKVSIAIPPPTAGAGAGAGAICGPVLVVGAGRRTAANIAIHSQVTLLWPYSPDHPGHSLLVDGTAVLADDGEQLVITPQSAILHRAGGRGGAH